MAQQIRLLAGIGLAVILTVSACGSEPVQRNEAAITAVPKAPAVIRAPACAEPLSVELDDRSFPADFEASAAERAAWAKQGGEAFKQAAADLCRTKPGAFAGKHRLLVQYGGGADSAAVYVPEGAKHAIALQYAFFPGEAGPTQKDIADALLCWSDPDGNAEMCAGREP